MSQEKLQAFAEAISKSEELQKKYASIQMEAVKSTAEKLAKLSESAGTPFTAEEYLKSVAESSEEMSKEQLQTVAGGLSIEEHVGNLLNSLTNPGTCAVRVVVSLNAKINVEGLIGGLAGGHSDGC